MLNYHKRNKKLSEKEKNYCLVRNYNCAYSTSDKSHPVHLNVGTLVLIVKKPIESKATIKIIDLENKYQICDDDEWECDLSCLLPVSAEIWPLLEAVPWPQARVRLLEQEGLCSQLAKLEVGSHVYVLSEKDEKFRAVVKFKGPIISKGAGVFFGLDLLDDNCEGDNNGTYDKKEYFKASRPFSGMFATIEFIRPITPLKLSNSVSGKLQQITSKFERMNKSPPYQPLESTSGGSSKPTSKWYCDTDNDKMKVPQYRLKPGDKVVWVTDNATIDCLVKHVNEDSKNVLVHLINPESITRTDQFVPLIELVRASDFYDTSATVHHKPENGDRGIFDENGLSSLDFIKNRVCQDLIHRSFLKDLASSGSEGSGYYDTPDPDENLGVGSLVEVIYDNKPFCGVIRWLGVLRGDHPDRKTAGVEMEEEHPDFGDGEYNGRQYFDCNPHRSLFVPFIQCRQDSRFLDTEPPFPVKNSEVSPSDFGGVESPIVPGAVCPISKEDDIGPICGKYKGIQGHHNSCYLDATLFSMFTFTSVFDSLLFRPAGPLDMPHYKEVQTVLREEIVNPLRKYNFVRADRVMKLRTLLEKLSSVSGLTTEEKDPEEFITSLVAQILRAEPFLKLSSGQEAYHYQLFVEKNEKLTLPTVQQLFEQSFFSSDIKLKEVPSCLIIQMPRFGKSYKMYPRILPSQLLDVTDVIEDSPRQCIVCGKLAVYECRQCFNLDNSFEGGLQNVSFCKKCVDTVHSHEVRKHHKWRQLLVPPIFKSLQNHCAVPRIYMQLFAVVCIETSHYVTFAKCGMGSDAPWCFFDSMADRKGEQNGYNIPEVVPCPSLPHWLSENGAMSSNQIKDDRQLPEHAKRLLCDAYMCMYQSTEVMMYR